MGSICCVKRLRAYLLVGTHFHISLHRSPRLGGTSPRLFETTPVSYAGSRFWSPVGYRLQCRRVVIAASGRWDNEMLNVPLCSAFVCGARGGSQTTRIQEMQGKTENWNQQSSRLFVGCHTHKNFTAHVSRTVLWGCTRHLGGVMPGTWHWRMRTRCLSPPPGGSRSRSKTHSSP